MAAQKNFQMFCASLKPLLQSDAGALAKLEQIQSDFIPVLQQKMEAMWASKLGLETYDSELFIGLLNLMVQTSVDYNLFFRELSYLPNEVEGLHKSFYRIPSAAIEDQWRVWQGKWKTLSKSEERGEALSTQMKKVNPKYTWREWLIVPAY
jgi:uncharacterized protein YdiU (UPF0061 family)